MDVYNIISTHQAYHTWSGMIQAKADPDHVPNTWVHLIGITDRDDSFLSDVAVSWAYPATIIPEGSGWRSTGYDFKQRAFLLEADRRLNSSVAYVCKASSAPDIRSGICVEIERFTCATHSFQRCAFGTVRVLCRPAERGETAVWIGQSCPPGLARDRTGQQNERNP